MSTIDPFAGRTAGPHATFDNAFLVTPSDTDDLPVVATALFCGPLIDGNGNILSGMPKLHVTTPGGDELILSACSFATPLATLSLPVRIAKVWATNTVAGQIWAVW